jgi:hypothetical protein
MNKMLKNICTANGIDIDDPDAERKAMDILTGNDAESSVHEIAKDFYYLCGGCDGVIESSTLPNMFGHIVCPHCNTPNIPNKP